jgi:phosphoribosylglycinamide formyltransferase 1
VGGAVIETGELIDPSVLPLLNLASPRLDRGPVGLAVLLSGTGRTLQNLLRVIATGGLDCAVRIVISSKPDVRGLEIAADAGIPTAVIQRRDYATDEEYSDAVYRAIRPHDAELILLAGFLRKLVVPAQLDGRILNIHPTLLPEMAAAAGKGFYGERVHAAVLASGATQSGATVHVVDNGYDTGPVVMRATVPVLPDDTPASLAARVFEAECALYPAAIRRHIADHPHLFGA